MRVKSSIKQPQPTGKTVAKPAYNRAKNSAIRHAAQSPKTPTHLRKTRGGRPPALSLPQALKITLLYDRHNLTEELLAELFNVSQPTVPRTTNLIEKVLVKILKPVIQPLEKALDEPGSLIIDGTVIPTWNWRS